MSVGFWLWRRQKHGNQQSDVTLEVERPRYQVQRRVTTARPSVLHYQKLGALVRQAVFESQHRLVPWQPVCEMTPLDCAHAEHPLAPVLLAFAEILEPFYCCFPPR